MQVKLCIYVLNKSRKFLTSSYEPLAKVSSNSLMSLFELSLNVTYLSLFIQGLWLINEESIWYFFINGSKPLINGLQVTFNTTLGCWLDNWNLTFKSARSNWHYEEKSLLTCNIYICR